MKKLAILATLLLALFVGTTSPKNPAFAAEPQGQSQPLVDVGKVLNKLSDSVFECAAFRMNLTGYAKGTCVFVKKDGLEYWFLTARHVAQDAILMSVDIKGVKYQTTTFIDVAETDATLFSLKNIEENIKPIECNLSIEDSTITCIAAGFWAQCPELTGTFGHVSRKICPAFVDEVYEYKMTRGLIYATTLIFPGFSGGMLADEYGRLLGINVLLTSTHTAFVDIRYIWNQIPLLNGGTKIDIAFDTNFDVLNVRGYSRVKVVNTDVLHSDAFKVDIKTLKEYIREHTAQDSEEERDEETTAIAYAKYLNNETKLEISGQTYQIARIKIECKQYQYRATTNLKPNGKYVYICESGWCCELLLSDCQPKETK